MDRDSSRPSAESQMRLRVPRMHCPSHHALHIQGRCVFEWGRQNLRKIKAHIGPRDRLAVFPRTPP